MYVSQRLIFIASGVLAITFALVYVNLPPSIHQESHAELVRPLSVGIPTLTPLSPRSHVSAPPVALPVFHRTDAPSPVLDGRRVSVRRSWAGPLDGVAIGRSLSITIGASKAKSSLGCLDLPVPKSWHGHLVDRVYPPRKLSDLALLPLPLSASPPSGTLDHGTSPPSGTLDHGTSPPSGTLDHGTSPPSGTLDHGTSPSAVLASASPQPMWLSTVLSFATVPAHQRNSPQYVSNNVGSRSNGGSRRPLYWWAGDPFAADQYPTNLLLPGTAAVQRYIFAHQHPADCSAASFYVVKDHSHTVGFTSALHVASEYLANALFSGRVFIWAGGGAAGGKWTDPLGCAGSAASWLCYFLPPTNCSLQHVREARHVRNQNNNATGDAAVFTLRKGSGITASICLRPRTWAGLPASVLNLLRDALGADLSLKDFDLKVWWRAQAVGYLSRLNPSALAALRSLRGAPITEVVESAEGGAASADSIADAPTCSSTISLHPSVLQDSKHWMSFDASTERFVPAGTRSGFDSHAFCSTSNSSVTQRFQCSFTSDNAPGALPWQCFADIPWLQQFSSDTRHYADEITYRERWYDAKTGQPISVGSQRAAGVGVPGRDRARKISSRKLTSTGGTAACGRRNTVAQMCPKLRHVWLEGPLPRGTIAVVVRASSTKLTEMVGVSWDLVLSAVDRLTGLLNSSRDDGGADLRTRARYYSPSVLPRAKHDEIYASPVTVFGSTRSKHREALLFEAPQQLSPNILVVVDRECFLDEVFAHIPKGWRIFVTAMPRPDDPQMMLGDVSTGNAEEKNLLHLWGTVGSHMFLIHFLQILMALESDALVGTVGSNLMRFVDELRCVWVPKCNAPSIPVGQQTTGF